MEWQSNVQSGKLIVFVYLDPKSNAIVFTGKQLTWSEKNVSQLEKQNKPSV